MSVGLVKILSVKYLSRWLILLNDVLFSTIASFCAASFAGFLLSKTISFSQLLLLGGCAALSSLISFYLFKIYKGVIRHSSYSETGRIGIAVICKGILLMGVAFVYFGTVAEKFIYVTLLLDALITFFVLITIRTLIILVYSNLVNAITSSKDNLLIFRNPKLDNTLFSSPVPDVIGNYRVAGFLHVDTKNSHRVNGHTSYFISTQESLYSVIRKQRIKAVLFVDDTSLIEERDRLVRYCEKLKVPMLILPEVNEFSKGTIKRKRLPEVRVEDLLSREVIEINMKEIRHELGNKVVMVTGAAGSIGSEICRQLCSFPLKHLVLFDTAETPIHNLRLELTEKFPEINFTPILGDVRNEARVDAIIGRYHPHIIFHAAAYKHVPLMEENPCEAVRTNVHGTRVVADAAIRHGVEKFVMISTDKAVNPTNVMGASKKLAEIYVQSLNGALREGQIKGKTRFVTTRFGNVLGSNGSVIPLFREQIAKGGPLTVTHPDIIRYFMTIPEACRLVLEAGALGQGGEIFVFDMGEPVKIADLAHRMIELAGLEVGKDIEIKYTGLRPGEKLYEELLSDSESTLPTPHHKIRVAAVRDYNYHEIVSQIKDLTQSANTSQIIATVSKMKEIVPEFISQNSIYEKLDKIAEKRRAV